MKKLLAVTALTTVIITLLSGCVLSSKYEDIKREGGTTAEAVEETLESIDGITEAQYLSYEYYNPGEGGLFSSEGMNIFLTVTIDPNYSIDDPEEFLDYMVKMAWSVNEHYPAGNVVIRYTGGIDYNYDWTPVYQNLYGSEARETDFYYGSNDSEPAATLLPADKEISVYTSWAGKLYGQWPLQEQVPVPDNLISHSPPHIADVPAIEDAYIREYKTADQEQECYWVRYDRGITGENVEYDGEVTITLYVNDKLNTTESRSGSNGEVDFCWAPGQRPASDKVSATIESSPIEGFTVVKETLTPIKIN